MPDLVFEASCSKQAGPDDAKMRDPALELPLAMVWVRDVKLAIGGHGGERRREGAGNAMSCLDFPPRIREAQEKRQRSAVWLLAIRVCSWARMEEREREKEGECKSGRRRSHGRYFTTSASTVPLFLALLSVEPQRRQKRQANMAQQANVCPRLHFGETEQD